MTDFLAKWPAESIIDMTLERYISVDDKTTMAYWLEFGDGRFVGSIKGGDASKFGIYKRKAEPKAAG